MLVLAIFLPTQIKRLVGQGNTGSGGLMTAAYMLAGLKGLSLVSKPGNKESIPSPPAASNVPQTPQGPSAYPVAPVSSGGAATTSHSATPPVYETSANAPRQIHAGMTAARPALEEPWVHSVDDPALIEMGRSDPTSNSWDTVLAVDKFLQGARDARRPSDPK